MRSCPICQAVNPDEAAVCYNCGNTLFYDPAPLDAAPTQPVRLNYPYVLPVPPYCQPVPPYGQPVPSYDQPALSYDPPPYQPQPAYNTQQPYWQRAYQPPVYPPPAYPRSAPTAENHSPNWKFLIAGLSLLLVIACGFSVITMIVVARNGVAGLEAQVFGGAGSDTPTPWPSSTPAATDAPLPTLTPRAGVAPTPNPTQVSIAERLLSPECKTSLDQLSSVGDQIKNNPLMVLDDTWRQAMDQATAGMKTYCGSLDTASPIPGEIGQVQKSMNQATSEFDQAKLLWNQAINEHDVSKAVSAAQHVGTATKSLSQAISLLQKLMP